MKVLFLKKFGSQEKAGEVKEVASGYARNFLFPNQIAVIASPMKLQELQDKERLRHERRAREGEAVKKLLKRIQHLKLKIRVKSTPDGKLYAALSKEKIVQELEIRGYVLATKFFLVEQPIKHIGEHKITLCDGAQEFGAITIDVIGETSSAVK